MEIKAMTFALLGRAVALECKREGEVPTDEQKRVLEGLLRDGWVVRVVTSLQQIIDVLNEFDASNSVI